MIEVISEKEIEEILVKYERCSNGTMSIHFNDGSAYTGICRLNYDDISEEIISKIRQNFENLLVKDRYQESLDRIEAELLTIRKLADMAIPYDIKTSWEYSNLRQQLYKEDEKPLPPYDYISACPKCNHMMIYPEGKCANKDCDYKYINKEM